MVKLTRKPPLTPSASSSPTAFTPVPVRHRVAGMQQILLMIAVVAGQSVLAADKIEMCVQLTKEQSAKVIEATIRKKINKPKGVLVKADFEKVAKLLNLQDQQLTDVKGLEKLTQLKKLHLGGNQLTDTKGLEKLTQLRKLYLNDNPDLTKAQIDELQKALPNCKITHDATK